MTSQRNYRVALAANSTASFASRIPLVSTTKDGESLHTIPNATSYLTEGDTMELIPYAAGADNTTFDVRVIGWRSVGPVVTRGSAQWIPTIIVDLACTASSAVGIAGQTPTSTDRFVDAMTVTTGIAVVPTVTANTPATAVISTAGFRFVEILTNVGAATNVNALFCFYDEPEV